MMWLRKFSAISLVFSLLASTTAWANEKMYMFPPEARKVDASDVSRVTDLVTKRITAYKAINIVTEESVRKILAASKTDMALQADCMGSQDCTRDLSQLINARYFLRLSLVGLRETGLIATAEIVDTQAGRILAKEDWQMASPIEDDTGELDRAVDSLIASLELHGEVHIYPENPASSLTIDGKPAKLKSEGTTRYSLLVGNHRLALTHPDYVPLGEDLFVAMGVNEWRPDQITLEEARTPIIKAWWFWTAIGVAAAGGATAAYFLTRPEETIIPPVAQPNHGAIELRF